MTKLTIQRLTFANPSWSGSQATPGQEVELSVQATKLTDDHEVEFRIYDTAKQQIVGLKAKAGEAKAKWAVPNIPGETKVRFHALLHEKPSPRNGHQSVLKRLESADLTLKGYKVEITGIDAAFEPKQEKLEVKYKLEGEAPAKGRYEIWGERYPSDKPLYTENFTPATGSKEWKTWDGKANNGVLDNKYISPEFTPYRVRIIVGPDQESVENPYTKGLGKVCVAEAQFEVAFQSVHIRLQANLDPAVQAKLDEMLAVEPRTPRGEYRAVGRLPLETEPALANGWKPGQGPVDEGPGIGRTGDLRRQCG